MKRIQFYEYSGFLNQNGEATSSIAQLPLRAQEVQFLKTISESVFEGKRIFDIGTTEIRATSLVGVVAFENVQIEILPKLIKFEHDSDKKLRASILKNLMFMLSYTNCVETADAGVGNLSEKSDSFIEAYIGIFASRLLSHLIRFGTPKDYVSKEENLSVIRGRIEFRKHSSLNCFDQSKVFCAFSEFSENNPLSQAFKYVAQTLLKFTSSSDNINTLNRCVGMLDGVVAKYISPSELTKAVVGKKNPNFVALISLLKMFLAKIRPEFSRTPEQKVFTLLFDMNELFEDFIIQTLKRHSTLLEIEVTAQKKRRLVSEERDLAGSRSWSPKKLFDTLTDISIKPKIGKEFIIDTKYKVISNEKSHYGISNQDAYQILAYRQIHKQNGEEPSVALLYPLGETALQKEFRITGSNTTFSAWTIDVSRDLKSSMNSFIEDLRVLIAHGTKVFEKDEAA